MSWENLGQAVLELSTDDKSLSSGMQKAEQQTKGTFTRMQNASLLAGKKLSTYVTLPLLAISAAAVKASAGMELQEAAFTTMLGSAERARDMLESLTDLAASTPFQLMDLSKASKTMLAFGIEAKKVLPNLRMLGDIAQGDSAKLDSLTLAFSQIQSTGRLMGQDLLQLINAGFNPLQSISEKTGETMAELKKRMEAGAISAIEVAEAFKAATSEGGRFYGGMELASQTLAGQWSTLKDNLIELGRSFGDVLLPKLKEIVTSLTEFTRRFTDMDDAQKQMILRIAGIALAVGPALLVFAKVTAAITAIRTAVLALNTALLANPYVLAVAGIVALGVAIFALTKNMRQENRERQTLLEKQSKGIDLTYEEEIRLLDLELARLRQVKAMRLQTMETARTLNQSPQALAILQANIDKIQEEINATVALMRARALGGQSFPIPPETLAGLTDATGTGSGGTGSGGTATPEGEWISGGEWIRGLAEELVALNRTPMAPDQQARYPRHKGTESVGTDTAGAGPLDGILSAMGSALSGFAGALLGPIKALGSLQAILNPVTTIIQGMMQVLGPVIDQVLAPIVGILTIIGQTLGQILVPIIQLLTPVIKLIGEAFVWLYNEVILPVGNLLITVFTWIENKLIDAVNWFLTQINKLLARNKQIALLANVDLDSQLLEAITYGDLGATGAETIAGGAATSSASYNQVRPIENNFYIEDNNFNGAGGLREFVLILNDEWQQANALGLV